MSLNGSPKWMYNAGSSFYPYTIDQSLRFNSPDSSYLEKTFSTNGNAKTFTISFWVKRARDGTAEYLFAGGSTVNDRFHMDINASGTYQIEAKNSGSTVIKMEGGPRLRDVGAWYHFVLRVDTTQGTAADRVRLYNNGNLVTFNSNTYPSQNTNLLWNVNAQVRIGRAGWATSYYSGYMAEFHSVDGLSLDPTYFGESKQGIWIPKEYTGSYGTNGFYLDFADGSALGDDESGNTNDFTSSGLASTDVVKDTPTNNFATLNPLAEDGVNIKTAASLSEGNLVTAGAGFGTGSPWGGGQSTIAVPTDKKIYCEMLCSNTTGDLWFGAVSIPELSANSTGTSNTGCISAYNRSVFINGVETDYGSSAGLGGLGVAKLASGDILQIAVDGATGKVWFGRNGTYFKSPSTNDSGTTGNPAAGTNEIGTVTNTDGKPLFIVVGGNGATVHVNFGADSSFAGQKTSGSANAADGNGSGDFYYTPPTDYLSLCSSNLPNPATVADPLEDEQPSDYFNTVLYTGDGTTSKSVTGVGFQPDWSWIKSRNQGYRHNFFDVVRGAGNMIEPSYANDDADTGTSVGTSVQPSFLSDGFTVGVPSSGTYNGNLGTNENTTTFVSWNWKVGGAPSTNNNGTIASSVSANVESGVSIVGYTGTGANGTVGHGLSSAPEAIFMKSRTRNENWAVYHKFDGGTDGRSFLNLNTTGAKFDNGPNSYFQDTPPTNSVFYQNGSTYNVSSATYIAYCFHSVDGFSKIGSYIGNSSADGTFVYCGFRPAWILIRRTASGSDWCIYDNKRLGYNVDNNLMRIGQSSAPTEQTDDDIDLLSNGFKLRRSSTNFNSSGNTHVFLAFSEQAFKYANAR